MAKNQTRPPKTRYEKINALLKRKLIPAALFSNAMIEQHELRSRRRVDGLHLPENADDAETPENCWERAGKRIRKMDPEMREARVILRELVASR